MEKKRKRWSEVKIKKKEMPKDKSDLFLNP